MEMTTFAVIGGDKRNIYIKEYLQGDNHFVNTFGFSDLGAGDCKSLESAIENCKFVIGPTPFSNDDVFLNTPLNTKKIYLDDFLCKINKKQILFAGSVSKVCREMFDQFQVNAVDFLVKKELAVLNAIPTAEGALKIAIESVPVTIHGGKALVIGYGNIGKVLAKYLQALGAKTYVAARREETLAEIAGNNLNAVKISELGGVLGKMDFIFNTVPSRLISDEALEGIKKTSVYIELASSPHGLDIEGARSKINIVSAMSLPGKISPKTAAKNIVRTIYNIIEKEEAK